jgi:hypothetical protein
MARVQQQDAGRDHLVGGQPRAVLLRRDQGRDQVVARLGAAAVDIAAHETHELDRGADGLILLRAAAPGLVHHHHRVRPAQEVRVPSPPARPEAAR